MLIPLRPLNRVNISSTTAGAIENMACVMNEQLAFTLQNMEENGVIRKQYFRLVLVRVLCDVFSLLPLTMAKLDKFIEGTVWQVYLQEERCLDH